MLNDWEKSLEYAQDTLLRRQTKLRVQFLREELLSLAKHAGTHYIAFKVGCISWFYDRPFLEADHGYIPSPDLNVSQIQ